jgi:plastocyanin
MTTTTETPRPQMNGTSAYPPPASGGGDPDRARQEWMMIAVALAALTSLLAIVLALVAIGSSSSSVTRVIVPAASAGAAHSAATAAPAVAPESLALAVKSDTEHGRLGPDGNWHDAFLPADFTVKPGAKVTLTITNYDSGAHSFTSPSLGVQETIPAGSAVSPSVTTFTFTAPKKPGAYDWWCAFPCDPWAMKHDGYMRGIVTVKA